MMEFASAELVLIRHAPAATGGRLCGRLDVPLDAGAQTLLAAMAPRLGAVRHVVASPAQRCRDSAAALFPDHPPEIDARLWEQDFGQEDGLSYAELPDLGPMTRDALAARRPERGESFLDMLDRVGPALRDHAARAAQAGPVVVVAHAGTVRAGLALALGSGPAALAFEVAPLSITRLRCLEGGWSIAAVNVAA